MKLGDESAQLDIEAISTGSMSLDLATGIGGVPKGRIIEVYGPESSGKTTLTLHMIAESQKQGGRAAFIDAEHALDPEYARNLGVNVDELLVSQPDTGEQALEICEMLVRSGALDIDVGDTCSFQLNLQHLAEVIVLNKVVGKIFLPSVPLGAPVEDNTNAGAMGIYFLTHFLVLPHFWSSTIVMWLVCFLIMSARPWERAQ
jgi:hypothetical protein